MKIHTVYLFMSCISICGFMHKKSKSQPLPQPVSRPWLIWSRAKCAALGRHAEGNSEPQTEAALGLSAAEEEGTFLRALLPEWELREANCPASLFSTRTMQLSVP